jgi:hypothetical protein
MKWAGGQASPGVSGEEVLPGKVNYIKGSDAKEWRTDIPTYRKVRYENVYPGVDVVFYGVDGRRLEYDLVVKPGADPGAIRLSFSGADKVSLEETGDVSIRAGDSTLTQHVPKAYQEIDGRNVPVSVRYVLEGDSEVRLAVASFEREQTLVIDPTVAYSTYLGGTDAMGGDYATGIVVDTSGSAYVCGDTGSTDFPTAGPPYLGAFQGITDCFVTKFAPNGQTLVYSTYLGGNQSDNCRDLVLDSSGRVYLTGVTQGNFPMAGAPYDNTYDGGGGDAFIAVLSHTFPPRSGQTP